MISIKVILFSLSSVLISAVLLSCGSSSNKNNSSSSGESKSHNIVFPDNSQRAEATIANAKQLKNIVVEGTDGAILQRSVGNTKKSIFSIIFNDIKNVKKYHSKSYQTRSAANITLPCNDGVGGKISIKGEKSISKYDFVTITNCKFAKGTVHSVYTDFDSASGNYKTQKNTYTSDMILEGIIVHKGSKFNRSIKSFNDKGEDLEATVNVTYQMTQEAKVFGLQNVSFHSIVNSDGNYEIYQTQGKIYINNLNSYVDYDTYYDMSDTPFSFYKNDSGDYAIIDNLYKGEARYLMDNDIKVKVLAAVKSVSVSIDTDSNGSFETKE